MMMQIGVVICGLTVWGSVSGQLKQFEPVALLMTIVYVIALIGLWKMRRWAALAFAILTVVGVATYFVRFPNHEGIRGAMVGFVLRSIPLLASAAYWQRMTWRAEGG